MLVLTEEVLVLTLELLIAELDELLLLEEELILDVELEDPLQVLGPLTVSLFVVRSYVPATWQRSVSLVISVYIANVAAPAPTGFVLLPIITFN